MMSLSSISLMCFLALLFVTLSCQKPLFTNSSQTASNSTDEYQEQVVYGGYLILSDAHVVEESTDRINLASVSVEENIITFFHNPVFNGLGIFLSGGIMLAIIIGCLLAVFAIFRKMSKTLLEGKHKTNIYQVENCKQSMAAS